MQPRPLPVNVPLVRAVTIDSYLARLAAANHLSLPDFRAHLGLPPTRNGRVDLNRLLVMTGHQLDRLSDMMVGAGPWPGRTRVSPLPASRPACRRCTTARGIQGDVYRVSTDLRVCRPHRRWLGSLGDPHSEQYDLSPLPDVVHAQRRQHRCYTVMAATSADRRSFGLGASATAGPSGATGISTASGASRATSLRSPATPTRPPPSRRCSTTRRP
jgi:hypothetical protein